MIRKSGIFIFFALLSIVLLLVYVFSGWAIRAGLVYGLEEFAGAEVNISKVSVSLNPLALDIRELKITDKNQPDYNLVSFHRAHADLEIWPALMGYYVIDELSVEGAEYQSKRKSTGKVYQSSRLGSAASSLSQKLQADLPSAEELLARIDLQSVAKGEVLVAESEKQKQQLLKLQAQLPDEQRLLDLQAQVKALTNSKISDTADLVQKTKQLQQLRSDVEKERDALKSVQTQLSQSREQLGQAVKSLEDAKNADWEKLQGLANIKDGGLASISQLLVGDVWAQRIAQLQSVYETAKPYIALVSSSNDELDDGNGSKAPLVTRILPLLDKPYPSLWIKTAKVDWLLGGGTVAVVVNDVTTEHSLINRSTTFLLDSKNLPRLASFEVKGDFAVREKMVANTSWSMKGLKLEPNELGGHESLAFVDGLLNSKGTLKLVNNEISQQAEMLLSGAKFSSEANATLKKLAQVLNQQASIPLSVDVSGTIRRPDVSVRSKLDRIIGDAVMSEAKEKVAALELKLKNQLKQNVKQQLTGKNEWLDKLDVQEKHVGHLESIIEDTLKAELQDFKGQAKDKLKGSILKLGK